MIGTKQAPTEGQPMVMVCTSPRSEGSGRQPEEDGVVDSRSSMRRRMALRVVLGYPKLGMLSGNTRDLSRGGMFVETGRVTVPRNERLRVYLCLPGAEEERFCVAHARVVHSRSGGVGLAFEQLDDATRSALNELTAVQATAAGPGAPGRTAAAAGPGKGVEIPP